MHRSLLFLLLLSILMVSCSRLKKEAPAPDYHPYILQKGKYIPAKGKRVNMDSVDRPTRTAARGNYVKAGKPIFVPKRSNYQLSFPSETVRTSGNTLNMDSFPPPKKVLITAKRGVAQLPVRTSGTPAFKENAIYPLSYLDVEQGLNSGFIRCMIGDRKGRIWIGTFQGGLSIWDGNEFMHFTEQDGLGGNNVRSLLEDAKGRIWIGTENGLSVWNGHEFEYYNSEKGLDFKNVDCLLEDQDGNIWIGGKGLKVWDGNTFTHYTTKNGLPSNGVRCLLEDQNGNIWIGAWSGGVSRWDGKAFTLYAKKEGLTDNSVVCLLEDGKGRIWAGTNGGGVNILDSNGMLRGETRLTSFSTKEGLSNANVWSLLEDRNGNIWMGTFGGGLNIWDGAGITTVSLEDGLSSAVIGSIVEDEEGNIYLGANGGGVNIWNPKRFEHFTMENGLSNNDIHFLLKGSDENVYVGTYGGGLNLWDGMGFFHYTIKEGLSSNNIFSLLKGKEDNLYIGTYGGGLNVWDGKGFTQFTTDNGLNNNSVYSLLEDQNGHIWIGTLNGVAVWDGSFFTLFTSKQGLSGDWVKSMLEDRRSRIWIGTNEGASVWDGTGFSHFTTNEGLTDNMVNCILEDAGGKIWMGTNGGINVWDGDGFTHYTRRDGLSHNQILGMMQDDRGSIWVGTMKGLNKLTYNKETEEMQLQVFLKADGLKSLTTGPTLVDNKGDLWIGAMEGLSRINLESLESSNSKPSVTINGIDTFNDQIDWRLTRNALREGADPRTGDRALKLGKIQFDSIQQFYNLPHQPQFPHNINHLTFSWQGVHWLSSRHLQYAYYLEGKEKLWNPLIKENQVTYQNLNPGQYTLNVRAIGRSGEWSDTQYYSFSIRPPWWGAWWAYSIYTALVLSILYGIYRFQLNRKLQVAETLRLKELDSVKAKLYTSITHEFRTPLTVIQGINDQIREEGEKLKHKKIVESSSIIKRNNAQLLNLVNQMLDLRKLESGALILNMINDDIIAYLRYIIESFHSLATSKNIDLQLFSEITECRIDYDPKKILSIVSNLISNAIKFTGEGGKVTLLVNREELDPTQKQTPGRPSLTIIVKDNGKGIPASQIPHIFDRFYQAEDSSARQGEGTGIGLTLTKELVKLLGGSIEVESKVKEGTRFTIRLPITQKAEKQAISENAVQEEYTGFPDSIPGLEITSNTADFSDSTAQNNHLPLTLIIEDNKDVVTYLISCLDKDYRLEVAYNGREGINKALELIPDLIVSDVMMPEQDGFDVCRRLKTNEKTSHIPIIMLTAKADIQSKLKGLERGADAYLPKPFNKEELLIRLKKLFEVRQNLRQYYLSLATRAVHPISKPIEKTEDVFVQKVRSIVEDHLDDYEFTVKDLCRTVAMSHSQLHRKITALTGYSANRFIRYIRLSKAKKLLLDPDKNIAEVAYETGFSDPLYFTRVFRKEFGVTPTRFREKRSGELG